MAIKVIAEKCLANREMRDRFNRECSVLVSMGHRNVVAYYDTGQVGDAPYLVMEYLEGKTIARRRKDSQDLPMPIISRFFGIIVTINYREHDPPHFHAWYSGAEGTVNIQTGEVAGDLPRRVVALLLEWWHLHREDLVEDWRLARAGQPLRLIKPLE